MTALCGGGTSSTQLAVPGVVTFTATAIGALLDRFVSHDIADFLAPFLAAATVIPSVVCSTDPPTAPTLTATDFLNLLPTASGADQLAANEKIQTWFLAQYWCSICKCDNGTIPSCTTGAVPSGTPVGSNQGLPSGSPGTPCWDVSSSVTYGPDVGGNNTDTSKPWLPGSPVTGMSGTLTGGMTTGYLIPTDIINFNWTGPVSWATTAGSGTPAGGLAFWTAAKAAISPSLTWSGTSFPLGVTNHTVPATAVYWGMFSHDAPGDPNVVENFEFSYLCTGNGGGNPITPCCPPDPTLTTTLNQILSFVEQIYSLIPVRVPNYAASTAHSGLTGGGNVTLAATTIAIQVQINTFPIDYGTVIGFPNTYIGVGHLTPANNEGPLAGIPIQRSTQVFQLPEASISIDYDLPPTESITITELQAG